MKKSILLTLLMAFHLHPAGPRRTGPEQKKSQEELQLERALAQSRQEAQLGQQVEEIERATARVSLEQSRRSAQEEEKKRNIVKTAEGFTITIEYLPVVQQSGFDCGFHTLKNIKIILDWLNPALSMSIKERDTLLKSKEPRVFPLEQMRSKCSSKTNLAFDEIRELAHKQYDLPRASYSFIQNIFQIKDNLLSPRPKLTRIDNIDPYLGDALEALKTKSRAVHAFIIGDMEFDYDARGNLKLKAPGHWIGIVALKENDKIILYSANSLEGSIKHDGKRMTQVLAEIIAKADYNALKKLKEKALAFEPALS